TCSGWTPSDARPASTPGDRSKRGGIQREAGPGSSKPRSTTTFLPPTDAKPTLHSSGNSPAAFASGTSRRHSASGALSCGAHGPTPSEIAATVASPTRRVLTKSAMGCPSSVRHEPRRVDVPWTEDTEVAVVERRQLRLVQPLDDRGHRRLDEADVIVHVTLADLARADVVADGQVFDEVGAGGDVVEDLHEPVRGAPASEQLVDFDQHRRRHPEAFAGRLDEPTATVVVVIAAVQGRVERSGVEN